MDDNTETGTQAESSAPETTARRRSTTLVPVIPAANRSPSEVHGAFLDFGGHITVAVAIASFGVVAINAPFFLLSEVASAVLQAVCFVGSGIWAAMSTQHFYQRLVHGREGNRVVVLALSAVLLVIGGGAVYSVMEYNAAARVADVCERVESLDDNLLAAAPRCQYYYTTRATSERRVILRSN